MVGKVERACAKSLFDLNVNRDRVGVSIGKRQADEGRLSGRRRCIDRRKA